MSDDYAVLCYTMQRSSDQKATELRSLRQKEGLSQAAVAKVAGISQSTVSRRERKPPQRHSDATYKLCSYAENELGTPAVAAGKKGVQKAFDEVWNRSDAHARAISKIIEAFAEFCKTQR
jgi:transcriptional regulator with XRE-family HTH domain